MNEKKYAKALLINDEIYDVSLLPIGDAVLTKIEEVAMPFDVYSPFSETHKKYIVDLTVRVIGTMEELKGIHNAKKVSLIPRNE